MGKRLFLAALAAITIAAGVPITASMPTKAYAETGNVIVVTCLDTVSQQISVTRDDLTEQLSKIGEIIDVPSTIVGQGSIQSYIRSELDKKANISAIQIVGGDDIVPMFRVPNPAQSIDDEAQIETDDPFADPDGDGKPNYPIARLPLGNDSNIWNAQFARIESGFLSNPSYELNTNSPSRNSQWKEVADKFGTSQQKCEPVIIPGNPANLPKESYFTAILLHGSNADTSAWWGEDQSKRGAPEFYPKGMDLEHANFSGMVYSAACYGADIRNDQRPGFKTTSNSLAMRILSNGAQCFVGSTRASFSAPGLVGNTVIPLTMKDELDSGNDCLGAFFAGKMKYYELDKTECNVINMKMRQQFQYYGLVPTSYWAGVPSAVPTDISINVTLDLSTSMDAASAYGSKTKVEAAKEQAANFIRVLENQNTMNGMPSLISLTGFSDSVYTNLPPSDDYAGVQTAINNLDTIGDTNLYAGLSAGISQLEGSSGQKIMVFLSDGEDTHGNTDAELISLAKDAASKGIKIYTLGFGSSNDINEYLLEQIATVTGGTYAHEDPASATSAAVGLFGMMNHAQVSATADKILLEHMGTVAQDQSADVGDFKVVGYGNIHIVLYWPGSILDLQLTDPSGAQITQGYPGFSTQTNGTVTTVTVDGAQEGDWNMSVYGTEVSMSEEPYYTIASFTEAEAPQVSAGAAPDSGTGLLILLGVVAVLVIGGVAAFSFRKNEKSDAEKFDL